MVFKNLIPQKAFKPYHYFMAFLGAVLFLFPSRKITVVGITGTSGKSTTVEYLCQILRTAGFKTASISSAAVRIGDKKEENRFGMTMPGRLKIQSFLKKSLKAGCKVAVIEVSSEGIKQFRHKFIRFEACVFTNLSPEHIESHGNFENYRQAKAIFFKENPCLHILNKDDENFEYFRQIGSEKKAFFSPKEEDALIPFNITGFNRANALAALKTAVCLGIPQDICSKALEKIEGVEGRLQILTEDPFTVVIDYAHTPQQLKNIYQVFGDRRKICVLGSCGGGRDKWKRPVMGKIAGENCAKVIVTNEDPYDENPLEIIDQVATGFPSAEKIFDRRKAIRKALEEAREGDVVVITGKGSEPFMRVKGGRKIPWSDKKIALEELESLKKLAESEVLS